MTKTTKIIYSSNLCGEDYFYIDKSQYEDVHYLVQREYFQQLCEEHFNKKHLPFIDGEDVWVEFLRMEESSI